MGVQGQGVSNIKRSSGNPAFRDLSGKPPYRHTDRQGSQPFPSPRQVEGGIYALMLWQLATAYYSGLLDSRYNTNSREIACYAAPPNLVRISYLVFNQALSNLREEHTLVRVVGSAIPTFT